MTLNNHCHAPMCLSVRVYACEKGTALEYCNADVRPLLAELGKSDKQFLTGSPFERTLRDQSLSFKARNDVKRWRTHRFPA